MQTRTTAKTTAAAELPVSLQEAKDHLRIAGQDLDDAVSLELSAAVDYCEQVTGRVLRVSHTVVQSYPGWPCNPLRFDWQPAHTISHVKYYDGDNTLQTVSSSDYRLIQGNAASVLEFDQDYTYPTLYDRSDAVQVTYVAGYTTVSEVPASAKAAILLQMEKLHGDRAPDEEDRLDVTVDRLLATVDTGAYR